MDQLYRIRQPSGLATLAKTSARSTGRAPSASEIVTAIKSSPVTGFRFADFGA